MPQEISYYSAIFGQALLVEHATQARQEFVKYWQLDRPDGVTLE
eukprot:gene3530-2197_t